jgi:hypothetical protein
MQDIIKQLQSVWFLVTCIAAIIFSIATNYATVADHEKRLAKIESQNALWVESLNQIKVDVAIIRTKLEGKK